MMNNSLIVALWCFIGLNGMNCFSPTLSMARTSRRRTLPAVMNAQNDGNEAEEATVHNSSRRQVFSKFFTVAAVGAAGLLDSPQPSLAADEEGTIWITGKAPKVPGQKPKDKNDTKGTRKDPNFLRSISDCKSQCENTAGPTGLARSKDDCLSECQDICCTTYEQCTFAIVPRI